MRLSDQLKTLSRYFNTTARCLKGDSCPYLHRTKPLPPPTEKDVPTVTYLKHDAKAKEKAENIEKNDPELWRIILAERVSISEQEIEAARNRSWEGAQDRDPDEIELGHVTNAISEWQGQIVFPMLDEADNEDDRGEFDKLFESILFKCTDLQRQPV